MVKASDGTTGEVVDAAQVLASIGEAAYEWCLATDRMTWTAEADRVLGMPRGELASGRSFAAHIDAGSGSRMDALTGSGERDTGAGVAYQIEYALRPNGPGTEPRLWVEDTGRWFADGQGRPRRAHGLVRVVTERHERDERLAFLSGYDDLTGQMNRARLNEVVASSLEGAQRYRSNFGFMLAAVENLGHINDAYGFDVADEVIAAVARRLRAAMRGGDSLGRYSGNKFGIVLANCTPDDMRTAADRFLAAVRDDVVSTSAGPVAVTITVGGVIAPRHARTIHEILGRAQESLDTAKVQRRGTFVAYRPCVERDEARRANVRTTDVIVQALNDRRVSLAFQPVVRVKDGTVGFHEALLRVTRPDGTVVPAGAIVPVAEKLGLVRLVDHRVAELAVQALATNPAASLSINVSPASATDRGWLTGLTALLKANRGTAERLIVEVTETTAIHDLDETRRFVGRVRDLGCRVAIDDFGAGYTSFRNLRRLGVDMVKIDGDFVENIMTQADDRLFVHTLAELARHMGLAIVAEKVQDEAAASWLAAEGCDYWQGAWCGLAVDALPAAVEAPAATDMPLAKAG